jgi:multiple sugar transport system ATP-binding protein
MPRLKIINLSKKFAGKQIIANISFETIDGEFVVVLGPSGCGKSTLLRLIAGLEDADSGEIYIGETRIDALTPQKRNVALVFQNYALYPHMTVAENLAFPLKIVHAKKEEIKEKVKETAELIGLVERLDSKPATLSGGQRQRVALGRAIIRKPDLFLLDEPLSNLDADLRQKMRRELVELQRKLSATTIYVTHDQIEAMTMADRMVVIESGEIKQIGTPEEVYNQPADTFVASFIGTSKINLIHGTIENHVLNPLGLPAPINTPIIKEIIIGIRPEDIIFDANGEHSGKIICLEFLGDRTIATIEFGNERMTSIMDSNDGKTGEQIRFFIRREKILCFDRNTGERLT